jgi:hypothetical protein
MSLCITNFFFQYSFTKLIDIINQIQLTLIFGIIVIMQNKKYLYTNKKRLMIIGDTQCSHVKTKIQVACRHQTCLLLHSMCARSYVFGITQVPFLSKNHSRETMVHDLAKITSFCIPMI